MGGLELSSCFLFLSLAAANPASVPVGVLVLETAACDVRSKQFQCCNECMFQCCNGAVRHRAQIDHDRPTKLWATSSSGGRSALRNCPFIVTPVF